MKADPKFIPALHWKQITPFYDLVLRWAMQETRFKRALIQKAQIQPGQRVLDLGCGTATLTLMIKQTHPDVEVIGLDADQDILQIGKVKARKSGVNVQLVRGFANALPYPDSSYDRVLSSLMFHHLTTTYKQRTMQEVYRVLRPGGSFLIIDFGSPHGHWSRFVSSIMAQLEEVSDNHKGLLLVMLRQAGFIAVAEVTCFDTLFGTLFLYESRKGTVLGNTQ